MKREMAILALLALLLALLGCTLMLRGRTNKLIAKARDEMVQMQEVVCYLAGQRDIPSACPALQAFQAEKAPK